MRLILTLEYDGTPFRGWAAQPGLPTIEARCDRRSTRRSRRSRISPSPAVRTRACTRSARSPRSTSRAGLRRIAPLRRAQPAPARRDQRDLGGGGAGRVPRAPLRALAQLPLPRLHAGDAVAVRDASQLVGAAAARRGSARRCGGRASSADTTSGPSRRRRRSTRSSSASSSGRSGSGVATTSTSRSRRTAISATWCAASWERWSKRRARSRSCC